MIIHASEDLESDTPGLSLFVNLTLKCYVAIWHRSIRRTIVCKLISLLVDMHICVRLSRLTPGIVVHDMIFGVEVMWLLVDRI